MSEKNSIGNLVVTGGAGFIGSHAAEYFAEKGWNVTVVDNVSRPPITGFDIDTGTYNWKYVGRINSVKRVRSSILNQHTIEKIVSGADAVIHTAGQVAVTTSLEKPGMDFDINARGTFNILEACRKSKNDVRLVFCSTNKVYGENVNSIPVRKGSTRYRFGDANYSMGIGESFPVDGCKHSPYGASKLSADIYVQEYGKTYDLKTACFRMSCIYGDRQFGNEDQGWVAHFVISSLLKRKLTIYGDGKQVRDVLYVDDLVRAYDAFISSTVDSNVFNIGGGPENTLSLLELVSMLESKIGRKIPLDYGPWRNSDQKVYISDISKAKKILRWKPRIPPDKGIERLLQWARSALGNEVK
ncbi:MAG: GDP-mannose 4,6-dehydratase [Thermoplasmata archaeon YP2-bin.285]|uniref:GDP-mannose 4,6-dehydratase n=1 Tax=Candidatus Sysuiplasma superficiale TaxID=2823368 RepID=A0A8J8CF01_9ARCH|nr:GDP-mannose 4,6-dehydratase [Candidatus Sysuiplasma superficiale]